MVLGRMAGEGRESPALIESCIAAGFVVLALLLGGASQEGWVGNLIIHVAAFGTIAVAIMRASQRPGRTELTMLAIGAFLLLVAFAQLVPLPPGLWASLPGHGQVHDALAAAGVAPSWRPLSLAPGQTLLSALPIVSALAIAIAVASFPRAIVPPVLAALLAVAAVSALVGLGQISSGATSPLYFYKITNRDSAVGFFANSNHLATLLALSLPLAAGLAARSASGGRSGGSRVPVSWVLLGALSALALLGIMFSGSLAGVVLAGVGIVGGLAVLMPLFPPKRRWIAIAVGPVGLACAVVVALISPIISDFATVGLDEGGMSRFALWQTSARIIPDFLPWGSGFGSFESVFHLYEDIDAVGPVYANHAHNDLIELALTAGIPGLLALAAFLIWFAWRIPALWFRRGARDFIARGASVGIVIILLHSLVDYPLRTEAVAVVFGLCCGLVARPPRAQPARGVKPTGKHLSA